jgi:cytoskeletal protein RodZ
MECELRYRPVLMAVADLLRDARERRGLTLEQLAHETKIPVDRLTAFEHAGLPADGGFYHRAQIRACAHALSLDERRVLDALNQELVAATPVPLPQTPQARALRVPVSSSAMALGFVIAGVFLSGTLLTRQLQTARAAASPASAPASDRTDHAVRIVQGNRVQDAPSAVARASLAPVDIVEPTPAPAATPAVTAAPAIPTAPVATQLVIATKPEGARVTVDGIGWGVTPVTIRHLTEGSKRIRVTADGYAAVERVIDVQPDRVNRVSIQLRSLPHPLQPAP